jgi:hypothetical protein
MAGFRNIRAGKGRGECEGDQKCGLLLPLLGAILSPDASDASQLELSI